MMRLAITLLALAAADWPMYRGPGQDASTPEAVLSEWPDGRLKVLWRRPVGDGYAGLIVSSGRVFTLEQRGKEETAAAYDAATGKEIWKNAWPAEFKSFLGGNGPRSTPAVSGGRVFVSGAEGEFRALDEATGRLLWRKDFRDEKGETVRWGNAWSPAVGGGIVYVQPNSRGASVAALDEKTGALVWKALDDDQAYTTPTIASLGGRKQLIVVTAQRIAGLELKTGELIWSYPWKTDHGVNAAQPVLIDERRILLSAGYGHGTALIEVACSAGGCKPTLLWENKNLKSKFNSPVFWKNHVYGLDEGILTCIELERGTRKWKAGRYGYGQLILASGRLIVTAEDGDVALVELSPEGFNEKARFQALNGKTWSMPALANGTLFVRNEKEMAAFRVAP